MQSRHVAGRRNLNHHPVGQVGDPATIGNVDGVQAPLLTAGDRFHDRDGELAGGLECLLLGVLMVLLLFLKRALGSISILDGYILQHFSGLPGIPVRRVIEPVQLVGAELVSPADIFADVTARRRGIKAEPPQQDARQADLVPVRQPVTFALGLP